MKQTREKKSKWRTKARKFTTSNKCDVIFNLPTFHKHREVKWNCFVDATKSNTACNYYVIIGKDLIFYSKME